MKDAFMEGFVEGLKKTAAPADENIFTKIKAKASSASDEKSEKPEKGAKTDEASVEDEVPTDDEKGKTSEASVASEFDRIISKLGLGLKEEKVAEAAPESTVDDRPSWIRKIAEKMDEDDDEEKKEKKEEKKEDKKEDKKDEDDDKKDEDKAEGKAGKLNALFAKMKS